jgi:p-aminobenzoyl-glutamate transporter AbgT
MPFDGPREEWEEPMAAMPACWPKILFSAAAWSLIVFLLWASFAWADMSSRAAIIVKVTVTSTSGVAEAAHQRTYLAMLNQSGSDTISCTLDGTAAVLNAAGTLTLLPLAGFVFDSTGFIPNNALNCISSGVSTALTLIE